MWAGIHFFFPVFLYFSITGWWEEEEEEKQEQERDEGKEKYRYEL